jgi:hypothetical protein
VACVELDSGWEKHCIPANLVQPALHYLDPNFEAIDGAPSETQDWLVSLELDFSTSMTLIIEDCLQIWEWHLHWGARESSSETRIRGNSCNVIPSIARLSLTEKNVGFLIPLLNTLKLKAGGHLLWKPQSDPGLVNRMLKTRLRRSEKGPYQQWSPPWRPLVSSKGPYPRLGRNPPIAYRSRIDAWIVRY